MTNAEKFKEVFGAVPATIHCPILYRKDCKKCKGYGRNNLDCRSSDWWNSEYKEEVQKTETKGGV